MSEVDKEVDSNQEAIDAEDRQYREFFDEQGEEDAEEETETADEGDTAGDVASNDEASEDDEQDSDNEEPAEEDSDSDEKPAKPVENKKASEAENYKRALKEERLKRQESQRQFDEIRQKNEALQKTLERIIEKANETPKPNFEDDPIGALSNELQETKKETQALKQDRDQIMQQQREAEGFNKFLSAYNEQVDEFAESTPDFNDAYNHLMESRLKDHMISGLTREQAKAEVRVEEARIAHKAMMEGINPGERIYELAKLRNYKPAAERSNPSFAEEKAKRVERGMKATNPIYQGSGSHAKGKLTLEAINSMDDEEFSKFDWKKLAGMM